MLAGAEQVKRIPGAPSGGFNINKCRNPTFSSDGSNTLAKNAPYPKACDQRGSTQCATGTAGAKAQTPVKPAAQGANGGSGNGGSGGSTGAGGSTGGSGSTAGAGGSGGTGGAASGGATGGADGDGAAAGGGETSAGAAAGGGVIDPDTGELLAEGGGDSSVVANPVNLASDDAVGLRGVLMALSALLLAGVVVGPPLTARALAARSRRKGDLS